MSTLSIITPCSTVLFDDALLHRVCDGLAKLTTLPFRQHCQSLCLRSSVSHAEAADITLCKLKTGEWKIVRIEQWKKLDTSQPAIAHLFDFKKRLFQDIKTRCYSMNLMQHESRLQTSFEQWQATSLDSPILDVQLRVLP
ncbi:hypothetical protein QTN94_18380 [Vibrio sp. M250220]|uniref:hypothetical protein n=1 Tax=Vibrio sp. M250220 TaxID=3020894 RepID=UPI002F3FA7FF